MSKPNIVFVGEPDMDDVESFLWLADIIVIQASQEDIKQVLKTGKIDCTVLGEDALNDEEAPIIMTIYCAQCMKDPCVCSKPQTKATQAYYPRKPHVCPVCAGRGEVPQSGGSSSNTAKEICPACHGVCVLWG